LGRTPVLARVDGVSWETSVWHDKTYGIGQLMNDNRAAI
jgi:hypothetical protein